MNQGRSSSARWTRQRWTLWVGVVFAAHLGLIWMAPPPPRSVEVRSETRTVFRLSPEGRRGETEHSSLAGNPTLFVLPDSISFSGGAWLNPGPRAYEIPDWNEPPRWLPANREMLGAEFSDYMRSVPAWPFEVAEKPPAPLGAFRLFVPEEQLAHRSRLTVEPAIAALLSGPLPELPAWVHSEPLENTVVEIGVSATGEVLSARLLARSGLAEADTEALRIARRLPFAPREIPDAGPLGDVPVWGRLTFQWHTDPVVPAETAGVTP